MVPKDKILVFMKHDDEIRQFLELNFDAEIYEGDWGDPFPEINWRKYKEAGKVFNMTRSLKDMNYKWIFSWLCPWRLPEDVLLLTKKGAINFHPGPPKYPGIGCYNYAIWNEDKRYGVTCHYMDGELDHGKIIESRIVKMYGNDTILSLKNKSIVALKSLFYAQMDEILTIGEPYVIHDAYKWGEYKSRDDFSHFCNISSIIWPGHKLEHGRTERLERRLRSTYFPGARDGPYIINNNKKWRLIPDDEDTSKKKI